MTSLFFFDFSFVAKIENLYRYKVTG